MPQQILHLHDRCRPQCAYLPDILKADDLPGGLVLNLGHMLPPIHQHLTHIFIPIGLHHKRLLSLTTQIIQGIMILFILTTSPDSLILHAEVLLFFLLESGDLMSVLFQQIFIVI